jgi:hypothetical protein
MSAGRIRRSFVLAWFTDTLQVGSEKKLELDDLPPLPASFQSSHCSSRFRDACTTKGESNAQSREGVPGISWLTHLQSKDDTGKEGVWLLVAAIVHCHGGSIAIAGLLKAATTALSFVGPLVLGLIVSYLEDGVRESNIGKGVLLVLALSISAALSALLNTNYNLQVMAYTHYRLTAPLTLPPFPRRSASRPS